MYQDLIKMIFAIVFTVSLLELIAVVAVIGLITWLLIKNTPSYKKGASINKLSCCVSMVLSVFMYMKFGYSIEAVKGVLLVLIMIYSSVSDINTRQVSNSMSVMLILTGFINISMQSILFNTLSSLSVFAFMMICAVISGNRVGGADVKYISAGVFVLGLYRGVFGLFIGLLTSVIGTFVRNKILKIEKEERQKLAMIPYLSLGFVAGYLI